MSQLWQSLYFYPSKRLTNITKYPRVNFLLFYGRNSVRKNMLFLFYFWRFVC
nr:MAG TPA: hypothetical protein [Caudoviricetes sp.]